jgi:hypothetical protein
VDMDLEALPIHIGDRLRSPRRPLLATQNNGRSPQTPMSSVS